MSYLCVVYDVVWFVVCVYMKCGVVCVCACVCVCSVYVVSMYMYDVSVCVCLCMSVCGMYICECVWFYECVSACVCVCGLCVYCTYMHVYAGVFGCHPQTPSLLHLEPGSIVLQLSCPPVTLAKPQTSTDLVPILVRSLVFELLLLTSAVPYKL